MEREARKRLKLRVLIPSIRTLRILAPLRVPLKVKLLVYVACAYGQDS